MCVCLREYDGTHVWLCVVHLYVRTHAGRDAGEGEEDGEQRVLGGGDGVGVGEVGHEELKNGRAVCVLERR